MCLRGGIVIRLLQHVNLAIFGLKTLSLSFSQMLAHVSKCIKVAHSISKCFKVFKSASICFEGTQIGPHGPNGCQAKLGAMDPNGAWARMGPNGSQAQMDLMGPNRSWAEMGQVGPARALQYENHSVVTFPGRIAQRKN